MLINNFYNIKYELIFYLNIWLQFTWTSQQKKLWLTTAKIIENVQKWLKMLRQHCCNQNDELDAKYELRVMILMHAVILSATYPSVLHVDKMIAYIEKPWLSWRILYHVVFNTLGAPADWKVWSRHASSFFFFTFSLDPNWCLSIGIQILNPDWLFLFD